MRLIRQILTSMIFLVVLLLAISPPTTQAAALELSPGDYMGKFTYSIYNTLYDRQTLDDGNYVLTDYTTNVDIEGTIAIEVDKKGNIKPGVKITITGVPVYSYYQLVISDRQCNVISHISAESSGSVKNSNVGSVGGMFTRDLNLAQASLQFSNVIGSTSDCQPLADQEFLLRGVNKIIDALNKFKTMQFVIVRASPDSISGTITIQGEPYKETTPGGFILLHEKGYFQVHNILSSLVDNPSNDTSPAGEWRTK